MIQVFLSLGSNLGNREENLKECLRRLEEDKRIRIVKSSSFYETEPIGYKDQPKFINAAMEIQTGYSPRELLKIIKEIEKMMGRVKTFVNGPRVIDIDILLYGKQKIATPELTIPHPRIKERDFVLKPLLEIAPQLQDEVN